MHSISIFCNPFHFFVGFLFLLLFYHKTLHYIFGHFMIAFLGTTMMFEISLIKILPLKLNLKIKLYLFSMGCSFISILEVFLTRIFITILITIFIHFSLILLQLQRHILRLPLLLSSIDILQNNAHRLVIFIIIFRTIRLKFSSSSLCCYCLFIKISHSFCLNWKRSSLIFRWI